MKIRTCVMCGSEMNVPKNSGKKWCSSCMPKHNREKARDWYHKQPRACRQKSSEKQLLRKKNDLSYRLYTYARSRSKLIGTEFDLTPEDIKIPTHCEVLDSEFIDGSEYTYSIDRIDNSKGYIKGNIQVISFKANAMKNSASVEELRNFAQWVIRTYGTSEDKDD